MIFTELNENMNIQECNTRNSRKVIISNCKRFFHDYVCEKLGRLLNLNWKLYTFKVKEELLENRTLVICSLNSETIPIFSK